MSAIGTFRPKSMSTLMSVVEGKAELLQAGLNQRLAVTLLSHATGLPTP
jgi:hypothetical protein